MPGIDAIIISTRKGNHHLLISRKFSHYVSLSQIKTLHSMEIFPPTPGSGNFSLPLPYCIPVTYTCICKIREALPFKRHCASHHPPQSVSRGLLHWPSAGSPACQKSAWRRVPPAPTTPPLINIFWSCYQIPTYFSVKKAFLRFMEEMLLFVFMLILVPSGGQSSFLLHLWGEGNIQILTVSMPSIGQYSFLPYPLKNPLFMRVSSLISAGIFQNILKI